MLAQQQPQTTPVQCSCRIAHLLWSRVIATSRSTACVAIRELGTAAAPQIAGRASECAARQSGALRSSMRALMLLFAARGARALRAPALRSTARSLVARRAAYDVAQVEEKWQKFWDDDKTFRSEGMREKTRSTSWTCSPTRLVLVYMSATPRAIQQQILWLDIGA